MAEFRVLGRKAAFIVAGSVCKCTFDMPFRSGQREILDKSHLILEIPEIHVEHGIVLFLLGSVETQFPDRFGSGNRVKAYFCGDRPSVR